MLQVPYLLFYPDRDRDDVPDGDPEVLLDRLRHGRRAFAWPTRSPGDPTAGCTAARGARSPPNIRGIEFQQGVWRYHPITHALRAVLRRGRQLLGARLRRATATCFTRTNYGGYAMLHGVQGAYYWKQFGKHGALHNPYAFGYFDHVPHKNLHGGHVTVGGIVYQGDLFPAEFRGKYIAADLLGHAVYWHELTPRGSTFSSAHGGDLLAANDTWFAPSDVTIGPDGAIYVADWHDQRTAHPDPDAEWDRTNGRIYRIQPRRRPTAGLRTARTPATIIIAGLAGTIECASDPQAARWADRERSTPGSKKIERRRLLIAVGMTKRTFTGRQIRHALEALWALYCVRGFMMRSP